MDIGKLYFESRATEEEKRIVYEMTESTVEKMAIDLMRTRCEHCPHDAGANRHTAIFVADLYGEYQEAVPLCWCCWFRWAFSDYGEKCDGPSELSRIADCERNSFGRWGTYARFVNRWPRRWLEGYLAGTPGSLVVHQPDDPRGV